MVDGARRHAALGGDLHAPGPGNMLLRCLGDDLAVRALAQHLAMEGARDQTDREHAPFEPLWHRMLDHRAEEGLLPQDLLDRACPSAPEITFAYRFRLRRLLSRRPGRRHGRGHA